MSARQRVLLVLAMVVLSVALIFVGVQQTLAATAKPTSPSAAKQVSKAVTPQYGGVLKIIYPYRTMPFGYPPENDSTAINAGTPALEFLLDFDNQLNFRPTGLATGFEIAKDGLSATITLRKGVKFHDGTDFNAQAAKWNLDMSKKAKLLGTDSWTSIDILDDYTIRIKCSRFDAGYPYELRWQAGMMISPASVEKNGKEWANYHPVGTGPFVFKSFQRDVSVKYEKNPNYWQKGMPYLDGVEFYSIVDTMVQMAALRTGEAHVLWRSKPKDAKDLEDLGYAVATRLSTTEALLPNSANPNSVLANPKVRQALEYAIDKEALEKMGYGYWRSFYQVATPDYPFGYNPDIQLRKYNPARAKELLAEAGYPNGFKTKIITEQGRHNMDVMTAIQSYWKAIGVDAALDPVPRAAYSDFRKVTGWDGFIAYEGNLNPWYFDTFDKMISPTVKDPFSLKRPPGWAQAFTDALSTVDINARATKVRALQKLIYDDATVLCLYLESLPVVMDKSVQDSNFYKLVRNMFTPEKCWLSK